MIYLRLHDRLGNILFMLAAALHLDKDVSVFCGNDKDTAYVKKLVSILNLPVQIGPPHQHIEQKFEYCTPTVYKSINYNRGGYLLMDGYFQSYRYFDKDEVYRLFKCPDDIEKDINDQFGDIIDRYTTVSVHVRRGDFLKLPERFPFVGKSYIRNSMNYMSGENVAYIFTSDDIEWCKQHFRGENIYYSENNSEYFDLFLSTKCNHNILSNSTFSWWGAFLNAHTDKKVIVPERWYGPVLYREADAKNGELIPQEWITMPCAWDDCASFFKAYYKYYRIFWRDIVPFINKK